MNKKDLEKYLKDYKLVPVVEEIYADTLTPVQVLKRLKELSNNVFLLESAENSGVRGRYSFLGLNPVREIKVNNNQTTIVENGKATILESDPGKIISEILNQNKTPRIAELPPFTGGLVGYISYDFYKYIEPVLKFNNPDPYGFEDLHLLQFNDLIVFDHFRDKVLLISNAETENFDKSYEEAQKRIEEIISQLNIPAKNNYESKIIDEFKPLLSETDYAEKIKKAKEYIVEGDIFQVVPSNRIKGKLSGSLFPAYRVMRSDNPSPYMYYLQLGEKEIAGASPETLVRVEDGQVSTFPIAGSRPRGKTPEEDKALEEELLGNEKELAEHNMLVDLGRNDIGRVSKKGTVQVEDYQHIQKYSKIMHITSRVNGELEDNLNSFDAIAAVLPAGTLSGAPKIRACQIIEELEEERRGPYGGALGYLGFNENMDMCIAIRSAFKNKEDVYAQSGGGIVYDSEPHSEYVETVNKAAAVIEALEKGEKLSHDIVIR